MNHFNESMTHDEIEAMIQDYRDLLGEDLVNIKAMSPEEAQNVYAELCADINAFEGFLMETVYRKVYFHNVPEKGGWVECDPSEYQDNDDYGISYESSGEKEEAILREYLHQMRQMACPMSDYMIFLEKKRREDLGIEIL